MSSVTMILKIILLSCPEMRLAVQRPDTETVESAKDEFCHNDVEESSYRALRLAVQRPDTETVESAKEDFF